MQILPSGSTPVSALEFAASACTKEGTKVGATKGCENVGAESTNVTSAVAMDMGNIFAIDIGYLL
jgi:DNA topoisomerase IB